jgi:hypothetical protein
MITAKHLIAALGFAFVAAWIGWNFGYALLCLVGAAVFYIGAGLFEGEIDLGELQARLTGRRDSGQAATARPRTRPRVE